MKKLYIVVTKLSVGKKYFADYLNGQLINIRDFSVLIDKDISLRIKGNKIEKNSLIYFRKIGDKNLPIVNLLANILADSQIDFIDKSLQKVGLGEDKLTQNYQLSRKNIPICPTIYTEVFSEASGFLGLPFLAKEINTQRNQGLWVIKSENDFNKVIDMHDSKFMFQKLMSIEKEYRLLVMGDKVSAVLVKDPRDYSGEKVETPEGIPEEYINPATIGDSIKEIAVKAAKSLDLQIAGVDLIIEKNTGNPYIIEVNRGPGITPDPKKSPELPQLKKYINSIVYG